MRRFLLHSRSCLLNIDLHYCSFSIYLFTIRVANLLPSRLTFLKINDKSFGIDWNYVHSTKNQVISKQSSTHQHMYKIYQVPYDVQMEYLPACVVVKVANARDATLRVFHHLLNTHQLTQNELHI